MQTLRTGWLLPVGLILYVTVVLLCSGCSLLQLKEETQTLQETTSLVGRVDTSQAVEGVPVIVAAFYTDEGGEVHLLHYTELHEPAPFELMVPEGACQVAAFLDSNENLQHDEGEATGWYSGGEPLHVPATGVVSDINFAISLIYPTYHRFPYDKALLPQAAASCTSPHLEQLPISMIHCSPTVMAPRG